LCDELLALRRIHRNGADAPAVDERRAGIIDGTK
jgi:hypothetical protein